MKVFRNIFIHLESNCDFWTLNDSLKNKIIFDLPEMEISFWSQNQEENMQKLKSCHIFYGWDFKSEWLPYAKELHWIIVPSAGKDYLPIEEIEKHDIVVTNCSSFHGIPMVEQIMAYVLGFSRGIFQTFGKQKTELWWKDDLKPAFFDLYGKTITIVGCGSVGKRLAHVANSFGIHVIGVKNNPDILEVNIEWKTQNQLPEALGRADIIVNLLPMTDRNYHYFNKDMFKLCKRGILFINVGRGSTVNETDLKNAIDDGTIRYCALDVFDPKPPKLENPLRIYSNVLMTPKTSVFFYQYMNFAVEYFVTMIKQYMKISSEMSSSFVEQKYMNIVLQRYFSPQRMDNVMDFCNNSGNNKFDFSDKISKFSRDDLLEMYYSTGRNHPFLAFTINSFCNRNCIFCDAKNHEDSLLTIEQYRAIAHEANKWNIAKAHLSGGEPTIRQEIVEIAHVLNEELKNPKKQIGITTNGTLSFNKIDELTTAGIDTFNFSLHSINPDNYKTIMGNGCPKDIIEKVRYCIDKGLRVKINCTLMRSYLQDAYEIISLAKNLPISIRLVELQNIGPAKVFFNDEFISETETLKTPMFQDIMQSCSGNLDRHYLGVRSPGTYYKINDWLGSFGFISNTSQPFCADGNRIKITPSGRVRPCTLENGDIDLLPFFTENTMENAFKHLFLHFLNRDQNPCHRGYHYIDYDLRWDNYNFIEKRY